MKLRCEILGVKTTGLNLLIRLQGQQVRGATWRDMNAFEIEIPAHANTAKAFYVGRIISIEVKP